MLAARARAAAHTAALLLLVLLHVLLLVTLMLQIMRFFAVCVQVGQRLWFAWTRACHALPTLCSKLAAR